MTRKNFTCVAPATGIVKHSLCKSIGRGKIFSGGAEIVSHFALVALFLCVGTNQCLLFVVETSWSSSQGAPMETSGTTIQGPQTMCQ
jgi:hypothetical protein